MACMHLEGVTCADHRRDLRERAAIAALAAMIPFAPKLRFKDGDIEARTLALAARMYADALVAELEKEPGR